MTNWKRIVVGSVVLLGLGALEARANIFDQPCRRREQRLCDYECLEFLEAQPLTVKVVADNCTVSAAAAAGWPRWLQTYDDVNCTCTYAPYYDPRPAIEPASCQVCAYPTLCLGCPGEPPVPAPLPTPEELGWGNQHLHTIHLMDAGGGGGY